MGTGRSADLGDAPVTLNSFTRPIPDPGPTAAAVKTGFLNTAAVAATDGITVPGLVGVVVVMGEAVAVVVAVAVAAGVGAVVVVVVVVVVVRLPLPRLLLLLLPLPSPVSGRGERQPPKLTLPSSFPPFSTTIDPNDTSPLNLPVEQICEKKTHTFTHTKVQHIYIYNI